MASIKKVLIVTVILFFISLILFLVYNFSTIQKKITIKSTKTSSDQAELTPKVKLIFNQPTLSSFQVNQNYLLFANQNGEVFKFDFSKQTPTQKIARLKIKSGQKIKHIVWSPQNPGQGIIILKKNSRSQNEEEFFNLNKNQYQSLNSHIQYINFSPDGQQIIYQYSNPKEKESFISLASPNGQDWKNIISSRLKNLFIFWGNDEFAIFYSHNSQPSPIFSLDIISHKINRLFNQKEDIKINPSPFSAEALISFSDQNQNIILYLVNLKNQTRKKLQIKTSANKCAFISNQQIYCAVPSYITLKSMSQENNLITDDSLFSINLRTGQIEKVPFFKENNLDIQEMKASPDQKYLFFIGRLNHWLYQVRI